MIRETKIEDEKNTRKEDIYKMVDHETRGGGGGGSRGGYNQRKRRYRGMHYSRSCRRSMIFI